MATNNVITSITEKLEEVRKAGERAAKAREYFKSVDTLLFRFVGSLSVHESESKGVFKVKCPKKGDVPEGQSKWEVKELSCIEKKMRISRPARLVKDGMETGEVILVSAVIRTYWKNSQCIGISAKNARFANESWASKETLRGHGHINEWNHPYKGEMVRDQVFNVNGFGVADRPSTFNARQMEVLNGLPDMSEMPE